MIFFSTLLLSMFITIALIPLFRRLAIRVQALDYPDARKVHPLPIPKSGGVAMAVGLFVPVFVWAPMNDLTRAILIGAAILVVFGLIDDFRNLGYKAKFLGQFAAALTVIIYGGVKIQSLGMLLPDDVLLSDWLAIPFTLIVIVGVINAINLSDGLDGLAGGICILSFCCIGYLAYQTGNLVVAIFSIAMIGTIIGFLRFNTYPAILFMGDAGSQLLGFSSITLSIHLTQTNVPLSPLLPLIILGFPILDTLTVISERISKGRLPFKADKNHLHHKLLRLNLFHTEAVVVIYFLQAILVSCAFVFRYYSDWLLLFGYIVFSGLVVSWFMVAEKTGWQMGRGFIENRLKVRLRPIRNKQIFIKTFFKALQWGFSIILVCSAFLPETIPQLFSVAALVIAGIVFVTWLFKRDWLIIALRIAIFTCIPFLIYFAEINTISEINAYYILTYRLAFVALALLCIFTLKFSRRGGGFKTTPADFLILFIALVVPNLPDPQIQGLHMGLVAAKTIVILFAAEVLTGEVRGDLRHLGLSIVFTLLVMGARGIL